uniref:Uncharacterized protein n=1 Tax=viral metagenome TaxID=1070528 RepID=A0A6M3LNW0_9ZZZZ
MAEHLKTKGAQNLPFHCETCKCELHIIYKHKHKFYCHKHALTNGWKDTPHPDLGGKK